MSAAPRLSIGLPVYNGESYLAEAVDALLGQSYGDFELIVSDNASTDGTAEICHQYEKQDPRVSYLRQPENIGAAPNHNFVFQQSRGEFFKWAAYDDLYARNLLELCVSALDAYPDVVLAHSWTAAIDRAGKVTQAREYPLSTDSSWAPERFRSMLFQNNGDENVDEDDDTYGVIRADDQYGMMRSEVLRRIPPQGSFYHSDRTMMTEIALHGPFYQVPNWLYFRRDHADRPQHALPTVRGWCTNLDPGRAGRLRNPTARLLAEYVWAYIAGIRRAPLSVQERRECYRHLARWAAGRRRGIATHQEMRPPAEPSTVVDAVVAGRDGRLRGLL